MLTLFTFTSPPGRCGYLPDREWQLRYDVIGEMTADEYRGRLKDGWRRFGFSLFRPECPACQMCQSLRVDAARFQPSQSQKRAWKANADVRIEVGVPAVTAEKIALYDRYHAFQAQFKAWPEHDPEDPQDFAESFVLNPFAAEEWLYYLGDRLVGVGYVDRLADGLSAVYFYYDPDVRDRSLGTYNVQAVIRSAAATGVPHVYLGFYVAGCRSLEYKAGFRPNQVRRPDGAWVDFRA